MREKVNLQDIPETSVFCCMPEALCECESDAPISCPDDKSLSVTEAGCFFCREKY